MYFTSSDPQAVLPADTTLTAGIGTLSATLKTAGTQSITATDTANAAITGTGIIAVLPTGSALAFTQAPAEGTVGQTLGTVTVAVEDANGNIVTDDNSDYVYLEATPNSLNGLLRAPVQHGVATFSDLTPDAADSCTLTASLGNLTPAKTSVLVNQATPTITWANPARITYGTPLSATQLAATASVPGTFRYNVAAGTVPGAGTQTLSVTFTPTDLADYTKATANVQLVVARATPTVVVQAVNVPFDGQPHGTTAEVYGVGGVDLGPATVTYNTRNGKAPVAAGSYVATGSFAGTANYTAATGTAPVNVSAASQTGAFGLARGRHRRRAGDRHGPRGRPLRRRGARLQRQRPFAEQRSPGALAADATLSGGRGTFRVTFKTAGTATLSVVDTGTTVTAAHVGTTVTAAAAASLLFATQPAGTLYGQNLGAVSVRVLDAFGNTVDSSAPVTLALRSNPGNGFLDGTLTIDAVQGLATFADLSISEAGVGYTLTATSAGLAAATSHPVTITSLPPGLSRLGNVLYVVGGTSYNSVVVDPSGSAANGSTGVSVSANLHGHAYNQSFGPGLTLIRFYLNGDGANLQMAPSLTVNAYVSAGSGNNDLQTGNGNDTIRAGNGANTIHVGSGNDLIRAGNGANTVQAGNGNNVIRVGNGGNLITGGNGNDLVLAGTGFNSVQLGNGNDLVALGGAGTAVLGKPNDVVVTTAQRSRPGPGDRTIGERFVVRRS